MFKIELYSRNKGGKKDKLLCTMKYETWEAADNAAFALKGIVNRKDVETPGHDDKKATWTHPNALVVGPMKCTQC